MKLDIAMEAMERIIYGDVVSRSEFYDSRMGQEGYGPLRRLMVAMLGDALDCLKRGASGATTLAQRKTADEAAEWIRDTTDDQVFSFNSVCETLGINPGALRESLDKWLVEGPRLTRRSPVVGTTAVRLSPYRQRRTRRDSKGVR